MMLFLWKCWQGLLSFKTGKAALFFLLQNCPGREVVTKRIALVYLLTDLT